MARGRGGIEPSEITEGIGQVLANLHAHGSSRFEAWTEAPHGEGFTADRLPTAWGWRRKNTKGQWEYYVTPDGFREMTKSFDRSQIAAALVEKGYLAPDGTGRTSKSISVRQGSVALSLRADRESSTNTARVFHRLARMSGS